MADIDYLGFVFAERPLVVIIHVSIPQLRSLQRIVLACLTCAWLLLPALSLADDLVGQVVGITDGDTLTLLVDREQHKIRLSEIDTPERRQPYRTKAKDALAALAFDKTARVVTVDVDRYWRIVGRVYVDGVDVNAELVRQGAAWVYRKYAHDQSPLCPGERGERGAQGLVGASRTGATVGVEAALGI